MAPRPSRLDDARLRDRPPGRRQVPVRVGEGSEGHEHGRQRRLPRGLSARRASIHTERFDDAWYPGEAVVTTEFAETPAGTSVTMTMLLESREARDGVLKSGMESGVAVSYDRLEEEILDGPQLIRTMAGPIATIHVTVPRAEIQKVMGPGLEELNDRGRRSGYRGHRTLVHASPEDGSRRLRLRDRRPGRLAGLPRRPHEAGQVARHEDGADRSIAGATRSSARRGARSTRGSNPWATRRRRISGSATSEGRNRPPTRRSTARS